MALLFFGLPRSLPYTLPSIHENVLQPLRDAGYRCRPSVPLDLHLLWFLDVFWFIHPEIDTYNRSRYRTSKLSLTTVLTILLSLIHI